MKNVAFLGCSRGFGAAVVRAYASAHPDEHGLLVARSEKPLQHLSHEISMPVEVQSLDFSKFQDVDRWIEGGSVTSFQRVFYFAGGGPYGEYFKKNWRDHQWAFEVNLLTPAKILHALRSPNPGLPNRQLIFVGSLIADESPDPGGSSYSAAKHGLRGLVQSVLAESPNIDLRLFRPGYIDTDLLPPNAKPRQDGTALLRPETLAQEFLRWANDPNGEKIKSVGL